MCATAAEHHIVKKYIFYATRATSKKHLLASLKKKTRARAIRECFYMYIYIKKSMRKMCARIVKCLYKHNITNQQQHTITTTTTTNVDGDDSSGQKRAARAHGKTRMPPPLPLRICTTSARRTKHIFRYHNKRHQQQHTYAYIHVMSRARL